MDDDWDDAPAKPQTSANSWNKKPAANDGWDDAPSKPKDQNANNGWDDSSNRDFSRKQDTDGWDDAPSEPNKPNNLKRNFSSQADGWDDEPPSTKRSSNDGWNSSSNGGWNDDSNKKSSGGFGGGGGGSRGPRKPDWICNDCSATVFGSRDSCFKCQAPKGDAKDAPPGSSSGPRGRKPDWICDGCGVKVFGSKDTCFKCQEPKGNSKDAPADDDGGSSRPSYGRKPDWICDGCGAKVFGSKDTCFKCQEPKGNSKDAPADGDGGYGGAPRGRKSDWICDGCGAKVFGSKDTCFKCQAPKGDSKDAPSDNGGDDWGGGGGGGGRSDAREPRGKKPGDWDCSCGHNNFASRDKCQKCDEAKPPGSGDDPQFNATVQKEFYIPEEKPDTELFDNKMHAGINFDKFSKIPVKVNDPKNAAPKPIDTFNEAGFGNLLQGNIDRSGYTVPTPIQKHGIPIIMAKRDLMACAQTGSGKTAAFLLPMIHTLMSEQADVRIGSPYVVIISPTRELAIQIYEEARKFSHGSIIKCGIVYGGTASRHQQTQMSAGCHILVATPGRLIDFCGRGFITFENLRYLVLDEADRMLDMGFKETIQSIMDNPTVPEKAKRQTLMFSATFPDDIQRLAGTYLTDYIFVTIGIIGGACSDVKQNVIEANKFAKRKVLMEILDGEDPIGTIVFVETKRAADFLASFLSESKHPTTSIHGDRTQSQREQALRDFKVGRMKVIIATSVAARGLDIPNVRHVINYDIPKSIDEYVHRIGRTGRLGNQGKATSFYDQEQDGDITAALVKVLKDSNHAVPDFLESGGGGGGFSSGGGAKNFGGKDFRQTSVPQAHAAEEEDEW